MTYTPNANYNAELAKKSQFPVYCLVIDGLTPEYSTHPVSGASPSKTVLLDRPQGGGRKLDIISGRLSISDMTVELLDVDGEITDLIATDAPGAPVSTLINREAVLWGGYAPLDAADYAPIWTGRIRGIKSNRNFTGYVLTLHSLEQLLRGEIMSKADSAADPEVKVTIEGNIVNVYWSVLSGTFDTGHATFPLDSVSVDGTGTAAPSGLGIASADINETQLVSERDTWHLDDKVRFVFTDPVEAKAFLEEEIFRVFQCWPVISGDGTIGLRFHVPALPPDIAQTVTTLDHIITTSGWRRPFDDHLNKFTLYGNFNEDNDTYDATLFEEEDTTDQTNTDETVEYLLESRGLRTDLNGVEIAEELSGRMRARYLKVPATVDLSVNFTRRNIEEGDVIAVTDPRLPNLVDGTRGIEGHLMTVISMTPDFAKGLIKIRCLDTGYKRYGVIAPNTQAAFTSATDQEKATFFFICSNAGAMSDGSQPYRFI